MTTEKRVRLPDDLARGVRDRADRHHVDESTAIRQLVALGLREHAVELYREGEVTLREAAALAGVTVRGMLDLLWDRGVKGNVSAEMQRRALRHVLDLGES